MASIPLPFFTWGQSPPGAGVEVHDDVDRTTVGIAPTKGELVADAEA
jgi:hypothetical protein